MYFVHQPSYHLSTIKSLNDVFIVGYNQKSWVIFGVKKFTPPPLGGVFQKVIFIKLATTYQIFYFPGAVDIRLREVPKLSVLAVFSKN